MTSAFLLLMALLPDDRAVRHYERMRFEKVEPREEETRRVVELLLRKEHWIGAFTEIADKFGRFPDDLDLNVEFTLDSEEAARTSGGGKRWTINFNLKRLTEAQKQLDVVERRRKEGQKVVFKVPPIRMERLIYHEMTHVLQAGFDAPGWFVEGMAQLVGDDLNAVCQFMYDGKAVKGLDTAPTDRNEIYARGHLFWKYLDSRGALARTYESAFQKRLPWKQALEEATNRSWANLVADEREWSEQELQRLKK